MSINKNVTDHFSILKSYYVDRQVESLKKTSMYAMKKKGYKTDAQIRDYAVHTLNAFQYASIRDQAIMSAVFESIQLGEIPVLVDAVALSSLPNFVSNYDLSNPSSSYAASYAAIASSFIPASEEGGSSNDRIGSSTDATPCYDENDDILTAKARAIKKSLELVADWYNAREFSNTVIENPLSDVTFAQAAVQVPYGQSLPLIKNKVMAIDAIRSNISGGGTAYYYMPITITYDLSKIEEITFNLVFKSKKFHGTYEQFISLATSVLNGLIPVSGFICAVEGTDANRFNCLVPTAFRALTCSLVRKPGTHPELMPSNFFSLLSSMEMILINSTVMVSHFVEGTKSNPAFVMLEEGFVNAYGNSHAGKLNGAFKSQIARNSHKQKVTDAALAVSQAFMFMQGGSVIGTKNVHFVGKNKFYTAPGQDIPTKLSIAAFISAKTGLEATDPLVVAKTDTLWNEYAALLLKSEEQRGYVIINQLF